MLVLAAVCGCHSHRTTVKQEETCWQQVTHDSAVSHVDTLSRRDSVVEEWLSQAVSLEWDSVEYHFEWDSAGQVSRVTGSRLGSRRSVVCGAARGEASSMLSSRQEDVVSARRDSVEGHVSREALKETKRGGDMPLWLEVSLMAILLVLAVGGVLHLRDLTDRWSRRQ